MAGLLDWVDPAREWWKSRPEAVGGLLSGAYQLATDPMARAAAMARTPKPFTEGSGQQMFDQAMSVGPSGLLGTIRPQVARTGAMVDEAGKRIGRTEPETSAQNYFDAMVNEFDAQVRVERLAPSSVRKAALMWAEDAGENKGKFLRELYRKWRNDDSKMMRENAAKILSGE